MRTAAQRQGKIARTQAERDRGMDVTCPDCKQSRQIKRRYGVDSPTRCRSCAMRGTTGTELARRRKSLSARSQVLRQGGIPNAGKGNKRGPLANHWKGGLTPINALERGRLGQWRKDIFARDGYTCKVCLSAGGRLHAHHIVRFADDQALRSDLNNGVTVCKSCHLSIVHHGNVCAPPVGFAYPYNGELFNWNRLFGSRESRMVL